MDRIARSLPAFSVAFGIAYLVSMEFHPRFTLFTYAPRLREWFVGVPELVGRRGPGMYWYSWLVTALVAGLLVAAIAALMPEKVRARFWSGWVWVVPVALSFVTLYLLKGWFGFR